MQENSSTIPSRAKSNPVDKGMPTGVPLYFRLFFAFIVEINRKPGKLEHLVSHSKQRTGPQINRKLLGVPPIPILSLSFHRNLSCGRRAGIPTSPPAKIRLTTKCGVAILNQMVNYSPATLDSTFAALSDATRRGILAQLAHGETSVSELAAPYDISLPAVSKHLRVLEGAGLVARHKDGRVHRCRLVAEPMKGAAEWIEHYRKFWEQQFDALARYLEESGKTEISKWTAEIPTKAPAPKRVSKSGGRSRRPGKKSTGHGPNSRN
jgi:DNA-binding transcriptional ArsR family regulator